MKKIILYFCIVLFVHICFSSNVDTVGICNDLRSNGAVFVAKGERNVGYGEVCLCFYDGKIAQVGLPVIFYQLMNKEINDEMIKMHIEYATKSVVNEGMFGSVYARRLDKKTLQPFLLPLNYGFYVREDKIRKKEKQ